ncbi:MAG: hypothetical protein WC806_03595 [Candidatus Gracilibacteria bacterium]|jgi:hypothetical protein
MTLRDYIAAKAMPAVMAQFSQDNYIPPEVIAELFPEGATPQTRREDIVSRLSYAMADAMLRARLPKADMTEAK